MAEYPFTIARSTGLTTGSDNNGALLASILAAGTLEEISNIANFSAVERYIRNRGRVRRVGSSLSSENVEETEKTTLGMLFWVYPTGLCGPFHKVGETEEEKEERLGGGGGAAAAAAGRGRRGEIELHGMLVAVESGVGVADAMRKVREESRNQGIGHLHIANQLPG